MQALAPDGEMAAVFAAEDRVAAAVDRGAETVLSIAAVNGPDNVVVSGEPRRWTGGRRARRAKG